MSAEIIFFGAISLFALLTIGLGISNWFYLSSVSSKIQNLENQVEKKTLEFEAIKKERLSLAASMKNQTPPEEKTEGDGFSDQNTQIEVVRNVRGAGFDHLDMDYGGKKTGFPEQNPYTPPPQAAAFAGPPHGGAIVITLFSDAKKDTDFAAAWKKLSDILPATQNPRIVFDFANVLFLYDREIQYLEKFRSIILQASGDISFVNCDGELLSILGDHPVLARHLRT